MTSPAPRRRRDLDVPRRALLTSLMTLLAALLLGVLPAGAARADTPPQPGNFRGWGFDQCDTPSQTAMSRWLVHSPFQAVGVYTSGDQRACLSQPNLTPTWVARQTAAGWRLLPITLGPQAYCNPRFPRYGKSDIATSRTNNFYAARHQGWQVAKEAVAAARALGIPAGSTLWYDLEGFDINNLLCRDSSLGFLHGWTNSIHAQHYVSGVYSSAGSGMVALDQERTNPSSHHWALPDRIWIARYDGVANVRTSYISNDGWMPGRRAKQYRGGHDETWGGTTINIDSDWVELGNAYRRAPEIVRCGGINVNFPSYPILRSGTIYVARVKAMQCLLTLENDYAGPIDGVYDAEVVAAANRYRAAVGRTASSVWGPGDWTSLLSHGPATTIKLASTDPAVRRLQRALNAAVGARLDINGLFDNATFAAVKTYQSHVGWPQTGTVTTSIWNRLFAGRR